jgi:hypothetical protein
VLSVADEEDQDTWDCRWSGAMRLEPELLLAAELTPERIEQFHRDLPTEWIIDHRAGDPAG